MSEKRGQLTVFVILGIVLFVAFAFLLFVRSTIQLSHLQAEADDLVEQTVRGNHINYFVESCLQRVTEDALYLMALQGGVIYKSQGGSHPDVNPSDEGKTFLTINVTEPFNNSLYGKLNVTYAIFPNNNQTCVNQNVWPYPFPGVPLVNISKFYEDTSILGYGCAEKSGAFGTSNLSSLCETNGANRFNASGEWFRIFTCQPYSYGDNSVQKQLEVYISNMTKKCVSNFTVFTNTEGYNVTVINDPNTTLTYGIGEFTVQTTYPFKARIRGQSFVTYETFQYKKRTFFKEFYEMYLEELLRQEYKNVFFDIDYYYMNSDAHTWDEWKWNHTLSGWDPAITLTKYLDVCNGTCAVENYDDLIQIVDNRTEIRGKPLVFNFLIKNRVPALDLIDSGFRYEVVAKEGDTILLTPFGKDPDEEALFYNYSGWRENYDAIFDDACCNADIVACTLHPETCVKNNVTGLEPKNWTESEDYGRGAVNASYKTNHEDLGLHYVVISIKDSEGLMDYQNVSVMVFDEPVVKATGFHIYNDTFLSNQSSIEDPYTLNAKVFSYFTVVNNFTWEDKIEPFKIVTMQNDTLLPYNTIEDITAFPGENGNWFERFNKTRNWSIHNITVTGTYLDESTGLYVNATPGLWVVEVYECLPFYKSTAAPYPYNNWGSDNSYMPKYNDTGDPFFAKHTCCDDGTVAGGRGWGTFTINNLCYNYWDYGSFWSIDLDKFNWGTYNPGKNTTWEYYGFTNPDYSGLTEKSNDILERTFERTCNGTRGNICHGPATQIVEVNTTCPDWSASIPDERCSGPPPSMKTSGSTSPDYTPCFKYAYTTFEEVFMSGTGNCNQEKTCSSLGSSGYNDGGEDYHCTATCYGGNCKATTSDICDDCRVFDEEAVDDDIGLPGCTGTNCATHMNSCTQSTNGVCLSNAAGCGPRNIAWTCNDRCVSIGSEIKYVECYTEDTNGVDINGNKIYESCKESSPVQLDGNPDLCSNCGLSYNSGWGSGHTCCGDDIGSEIVQTSAGIVGDSTTACCQSSEFCVLSGTCYTHGYTGTGYTCNHGTWV